MTIFRATTSRLRLVVCVLVLFVASACQAATEVNVEVNEDGSGVVDVQVILDAETADGVLDLDAATGLPLLDLSEAGWTVEPPATVDGMTTIGASKPFGTPEQFAEIMAELSGDAPLFSDFELLRTKSFARVDYQVEGQITPSGLEALGDEALTAALDRSLTDLTADLGGSASDLQIGLTVVLPGNPDSEVEPTGQPLVDLDDGVGARFTTDLAADTATPVLVASSSRGVAALVWRGVAIVAGVLAILVAFGHLLRLLRPERRRRRKTTSGKPRPSAKGDGRPKPAAAEVVEGAADLAEGTTPEQTAPAVVALDGMGVLYREGSDIAEILIPFARELGSQASEDAIQARARMLSLGRLTPADFWQSIGVDGDPNELDDAYLARHQLNPGVVKFLRDLRDRGVQVACITDDAAAWAHKLQVRHSLGGLIDPWVVSGSVGVRKPDAPIFEVLRRVTGRAPSEILVVDDRLDNLDAARQLGFQTAWFAPQGDVAGSRGHAILRSFAVAEAAPESA
ncbi:MAG: HAD family hydrolase [Acidimicrobiales bacterium]